MTRIATLQPISTQALREREREAALRTRTCTMAQTVLSRAYQWLNGFARVISTDVSPMHQRGKKWEEIAKNIQIPNVLFQLS